MRRLSFLLLGALLFSGCDSTPSETSAKPVAASPSEPSVRVSDPKPPSFVDQVGDKLLPKKVRRADYWITKMELERAEGILDTAVGPEAARARARLAIYRADCEAALGHLASESARAAKGAPALLDLAQRCHGATSGGLAVEEKTDGIWIRYQDEADRVLHPLLVDVAKKARLALSRDLGVTLPHPLRIDLVRDLFSLSAVSGLPLDAAETTGTVAVARWGRVTMVSPRAMRSGFPWADTLAHEITHLLISRATADRAPLWLQEGIAKRQEHRWRAQQLFDEEDEFSKRALSAQRRGASIGIDQIGPSIAMLPSAEAASTAFAEVTSFMEYWIGKNGPRSLSALLRDIEVAPDADSAMRSVSGYGVTDWQLVWRADLEKRFPEELASEERETSDRLGPRALSRSLRLTELLSLSGDFDVAAELSSVDLDRAAHSSALRFLAGRAAWLSSRDDVEELLGSEEEVESAHAGWLAFSAFLRGQKESRKDVEAFLEQAAALDPLLAESACSGVPWVGEETSKGPELPEVKDPLCMHARTLTPRGSR